ncbi:hypothetical protein ScPMuIL_014372 [Solemya velum]
MTERELDENYTTSVNWEFMSVHFWGEEANGDWTLEMTLKEENVTGKLTKWDLTLDGSTTDPIPDLDMCADSPCENNATCTDLNYAFKCDCLLHYYGDRCENKTIFCYDKPCQNGGNCTDDPAGYYCNCTENFMGTNCETVITTTTEATTTEETTPAPVKEEEEETPVVAIVAGTVGAVATVAIGVVAGLIIKAKCIAANSATVGTYAAGIQPIP